MMKLPSGYFEVLAEGAAVLISSTARLRTEAGRQPEKPEKWLAVRDLEGLAERLVVIPRREWEEGSAILLITGQDVGALDALLAASDGGSEQDVATVSGCQVASLVRLVDFLRRYLDGDFPANAPAA